MDKLIKIMIKEAHEALNNAYAPYSKFTVASCILTTKNNRYIGVNVENGSYGLTVCAESSAICTMVSSGEQQIKSMVVLAGTNLLCSPCGACRQRIFEFSTPETMIHLCNKDSIFQSIPIIELLPLAFDFKPGE
jgi:cytidine deaminase